MIGASFDSTKTPLQELLAQADSGKLQLPDFQRGWVWDDERICSLVASVSVSFPIGAVMLLETGCEHIRFKPRPLSGTKEDEKPRVPRRSNNDIRRARAPDPGSPRCPDPRRPAAPHLAVPSPNEPAGGRNKGRQRQAPWPLVLPRHEEGGR